MFPRLLIKRTDYNLNIPLYSAAEITLNRSPHYSLLNYNSYQRKQIPGQRRVPLINPLVGTSPTLLPIPFNYMPINSFTT